ncbi:MAG: ABC transporter substrate-binding protein [Deltaproteobacteria bacterium]|nr:ABC transporter substrate-binding protein [Deltaproteobacteria bacterium]
MCIPLKAKEAKNLLIIIVGGMLLTCTSVIQVSAQSKQPIEVIREAITKALKIMNETQYMDGSKEDQMRQRIWETIREEFDYREITRRVLSRNLKKFSSAQKQEFTVLLTEFLKNTYLNRLKGQYRDANFTYESQELLSDKKAIVKTKLKRRTLEVSVHYSMRYHDQRWRIYDIRIEGVSMVKNYRMQFNEILVKESPAQLIERLRTKLKLQKAASRHNSKSSL